MDIAETKCPLCNKWQPTGSGPALRTREKRMSHSGRRSGLRSYDPDAIRWPIVDNEGRRIWTGERKELGGFPEHFLQQFLDDFYNQRGGLNPKGLRADGATYQCIDCEAFFPLKRDAEAAAVNWLTIDHRMPIRDWVILACDVQQNYVDGHLWRYYLLDDCKANHLDPRNLDPMCQSCNSSKNGDKNLDGEMRDHLETQCRKCKRRFPDARDRPY